MNGTDTSRRRITLRDSVVVVSLLAICLATSLVAAFNASTPPLRLTNAGFLKLARHGMEGTFEATYVVHGLPHARYGGASGIVVVAQKAAQDASAWPNNTGKWSYVVRLDDGWGFQFIEHGNSINDCELKPGHKRWICAGPGRFTPSIGFELTIYPFLPGSAFQSLDAIFKGLTGDEQIVGTFTSSSHRFGALECLRAIVVRTPASWCLNHAGFLVREVGEGEMGYDWPSIQLVRLTHVLSNYAFVPLGKLKTPFVLYSAF